MKNAKQRVACHVSERSPAYASFHEETSGTVQPRICLNESEQELERALQVAGPRVSRPRAPVENVGARRARR